MNRRPRALPAAVILALVAAAAGCAGARVEVTAERSRYAISMSELVRDQTGRLHDRSSLEKVGDFKSGGTRIGFFYSLLTIPWTLDVSDDVNAQVSAAGGEAIVRAAVTVAGSCDVLNSFPFLNALPLWPGCVPVTVTGDIVRRKTPPAP